MAKRIKRKDREQIEALVREYGAAAIIKAAGSLPPRKSGRPPDNANKAGNLVAIWSHIELIRSLRPNRPYSVLHACTRLSKNMGTTALSVSTLRAFHSEAKMLHRTDQNLRTRMDERLNYLKNELPHYGDGAVAVPIVIHGQNPLEWSLTGTAWLSKVPRPGVDYK